jgi:SAM-dependent methyltransferase
MRAELLVQPDKFIECARYDDRAKVQLDTDSILTSVIIGSETMPTYLRPPYIAYEKKIADLIQPGSRVLELGAGTGLHTLGVLRAGADLVASDISPNALRLLELRFRQIPGQLTTVVADMENLPFEASSFDSIVCAGALSYGDPHVVDAEIRRVLRPGGTLICVDSLNENPVYRMNRWVHWLCGNRSKSTLRRMPNLSRIEALGVGFSDVNVQFFGGLTFVMPVLARLLGADAARLVSDRFDRLCGVRRSAFKFVFVAEGLA